MSDPQGSVPQGKIRRGGHGRAILGRLRAYFLAGLLISAPIGVTLYIAYLGLTLIDSWINPLIPPRWNPETYLPVGIPGLGLLIVIVLLTLIGAATANYVGDFFVRLSDRILTRMPVIRGIYGAVKQLVEAVFGHESDVFRQVVLIEWPRAGTWTLGFIPSNAESEPQRRLADDVVSVMIPTTPLPTVGYLLFVPRSEVVMLDMSVDDAMKLVISSGIVVPSYTRG